MILPATAFLLAEKVQGGYEAVLCPPALELEKRGRGYMGQVAPKKSRTC